jgi:hypothetical protein
MNTALPSSSQPVKFLNATVTPPMRRVNFFIDTDTHTEISEIARCEGLDFSATIRELVSYALRSYKLRRGTLNGSLPQNTKTFFCQICGQLTSMRRLHRAQVLTEEYQFCENCFFAGRHKQFIIILLNRT